MGLWGPFHLKRPLAKLPEKRAQKSAKSSSKVAKNVAKVTQMRREIQKNLFEPAGFGKLSKNLIN
jgi:hypothetical protein